MSDEHPTFLSVFAGVGGFDLGFERAGFWCVGQIELDPFCQRILTARWPGVPRYGDVRSDRTSTWLREVAGPAPTGNSLHAGGDSARRRGAVDLLVGGFPCQGASIAGKRLGLRDDRTALFWELCRIQEIIHAPWGLFENVPGLRSVALGRDFETVLAALKECWPVVGWRTLDSRYFGVPQRRARVFFVCDPDEARVSAVLFEPDGGGGHPPTGREAGARVARSLAVGASGPGSRYDPNGEEFVIAPTLNAGDHDGGFRTEPAHLVPALGFAWSSGGDVRMNIKDEEEGTLQGNQAPAVAYQQHGTNVGEMGALRKGDGGVTSGVPFIAHALSAEGADASEDGTGRGTPLVWDETQITSPGNYSAPRLGDPSHPLAAGARPPAIVSPMIVRRLTPTECARLQAFPDGWCCICQSLEAWATDPEAAAELCRCPDGPQYRAYGNAVTVSVIEWLGGRLRGVMTPAPSGCQQEVIPLAVPPPPEAP